MAEKPTAMSGREKEPESDDPMELVPNLVPTGDPELMATCFIEEYARMGMDEEEIFGLFSRPVYQTHALYLEWGEPTLRNLIRKVLSRTGRMRVSVQTLHQIGD